jgi:hypothetical protein
VKIAHIRDIRNMYIVLIRKCEGKRLFGKLIHRWKDNIKMDLK